MHLSHLLTFVYKSCGDILKVFDSHSYCAFAQYFRAKEYTACIVPEVRVELTWPCGQRILSPPCIPFHHSGRNMWGSILFDSPRKKLRFFLEAWGGIEPPNKAFAELCLTTWPPRLSYQYSKPRTINPNRCSAINQFSGGCARLHRSWRRVVERGQFGSDPEHRI